MTTASSLFLLFGCALATPNMAAELPPFSAAITVVHTATCAYSDGELEVVITGGVPPYAVVWDDDGSAGIGRTGLVAGTYGVTVTDANSDQVTAQVDLPSVNYDMDFNYWDIPYCNAPSALVPWTNAPMGAPGPWFVDGQELSLAPGSAGEVYVYYPSVGEGQGYFATVSDGNGCTGTMHGGTGFTVQWPQTEITSVEPSCSNQPSGAIHVHMGVEGHQQNVNLFITGGNQPPFFQGFTSYDQPQDVTFTDLTPGLYGLYWSLGVTYDLLDPGDCIMDTLWVTVPDQGVLCGRVEGNSWYDVDVDCFQDPGEVAVGYNTLLVQPGNLIVITDGNGRFNFPLPDGSYTLEQTSSTLTANCPSQPVPFTVNSDITTIDFADLSTAPLDLAVYAAASLPKPGFPYPIAAEVRNYSPQLSGALTVSLELDPALMYASADPTPTSVAGNTLTWSLPALGSFAHTPLHVNATVAASTPIGTVLHSTVSGTGTVMEPNTDNNTFILNATVEGSVDPNDKSVLTSSRASNELYYIDSDDYMDYTIRFQNTGTAAATFVIVTDTLSEALDMTSFEQGVSSHPFTVSFKPGRVVEWRFDDIQLADSTSDEAASHGLVSFRIKPVQPLLPGTVISNNADIFFDFNEPVRTNDAVLLAELSTGIREAGAEHLLLQPNPASEQVEVSASREMRYMALWASDGRLVQSSDVRGTTAAVLLHALAPGLYTVQVTLQDGSVQRARLVKR